MGSSIDLAGELLALMGVVARMGLFELNSGHASVRTPDGDRFVIPRHLHGAGSVGGLDSLTVADVVEVSIAGGRWRGELEPPEEVHLHTEIYRARRDVGAIVHTHAEHPVALSVADQPVLPVHHHGALFAPAVPIYPRHAQISDGATGRELADALGGAWSIVLRAHGTVSVGRTAREAAAVAFTLDQCARRQLLAAQAGTPRGLDLEPGARRELSSNTIRNVWFHFGGA